mgnify:CR=1 FL=1
MKNYQILIISGLCITLVASTIVLALVFNHEAKKQNPDVIKLQSMQMITSLVAYSITFIGLIVGVTSVMVYNQEKLKACKMLDKFGFRRL